MNTARVSTAGALNRLALGSAVIALVVGLVIVWIVPTSNLAYFAGTALVTYSLVQFIAEFRRWRSSSR